MSKANTATELVSDQGNPLAPAEPQQLDVAQASAAEYARREIEGAMILAQKFPRNEVDCYQAVMHSCKRFGFADKAVYSFPRGGTTVKGPSINMARELARLWGNIRYGADLVADDHVSRTIRCWAWDLQSNTRPSQDATFKKLIQRKGRGWVTPDERDLRELSNKHAAIGIRNCLLQLMPPDYVADALAAAEQTIVAGISDDKDAHTKKVLLAFDSLGIRASELETHLGKPLAQATVDDIAALRKIYASIMDGNSEWSDYAKSPETPQDGAGVDLAKMAAGTKTPKKTPQKAAQKG